MTGDTVADEREREGAMSEGVFVHPQGLCESTRVGAGTRVWAFAHVLPKASLAVD